MNGIHARKYRRQMIVLIVIAAVLVVLAGICLWGAWENTALQLHHITVEDDIPESFDGFTFVHISDLHNTQFGEDQTRLMGLMAESKADAIVVTGDVIDKRRPGTKHALDFFARAVKLAPVYYVAGNHEAVSAEYPALRRSVEEMGVHVLDDRSVALERGGGVITLAGVNDPIFTTDEAERNEALMREKLENVIGEKQNYTVLLTHRPELFRIYREAGVDLVFAGHAHGGQFRLPWGQGVIAPNQGLFPKYTQGLYDEEGGKMVVSRGLGNSSVPIRLNNRPEVVVVRLAASHEEKRV